MRYRLAPVLFVLPAVALVGVMMYAPFFSTAYLSFTRYNGLGSPEFVGLANFVRMFRDPAFLQSMTNTGLWVVGTLAIPVTFGLALAVLTYDFDFGSRLRLPFLLPFGVSGLAVGVMWSFMLQNGGALNQALAALNLPGAELRWLIDSPLNTFVMICVASWQGIGVNALLFAVGLQAIPKETIEAARLDGAAAWPMFRNILWPQLRPLTVVVVGLSLVISLKTFDIVWGMTRGGPGRQSETLALTMYHETFILSSYGRGATIALFLAVLTVGVAVTYMRRQLAATDESQT